MPVPPRARLLLLVLAGAFLAASCSPVRLAEAVRVTKDIEAGPQASALKAAVPAPRREAISYAVEDRFREADLYTPGEPAAADMVLIPGLTPKGRQDPRLIAFAETLARARFRVLVPDLPNLRRFQVTGDDAVPIADAVCALQQTEARRPLGLTAVSFAVGPAVAALFQPHAQDRVDFLLGIGGYYDMTSLITYVTTGYYRRSVDAPWQFREPKAYGKWVFLLTNAARLEDLDDRLTLIEIAEKKLDDPNASVDELTVRLGPEGRSVYALLENTDPDRVPELLAAAPAPVRREADALDIKRRNLTQVRTEFLLVHDRNDRIIPSEQSLMLAEAAAEGQAKVFLVTGLDHAQPKDLGIGGALTLIDAVYTLLGQRDGGDSPRPPCPHVAPPITEVATAAAALAPIPAGRMPPRG